MQFFCKMCYDLGRPDFNKHNVRDSARNTTCPYLLNTKCKNCGYFGHTSTYCKNTRLSNFTSHKSFVKHIDIVKSIPTLINKKIDLFSSQVNQNLNGI